MFVFYKNSHETAGSNKQKSNGKEENKEDEASLTQTFDNVSYVGWRESSSTVYKKREAEIKPQ